LLADGIANLMQSLDFARDIGADLVNLHLYMDEGPEGYVCSLEPVIRRAVSLGLRLSIENTPHTTPQDFNRVFSQLQQHERASPATVGMCLDIGHAGLCAEHHNDYVGYLDALSAEVPIVHLHVHENYGDRDSHLTLFTGPSRDDDSQVRALLDRLQRRSYSGAMILEQWPNPPHLLLEAAEKLRHLLGLVETNGF